MTPEQRIATFAAVVAIDEEWKNRFRRTPRRVLRARTRNNKALRAAYAILEADVELALRALNRFFAGEGNVNCSAYRRRRACPHCGHNLDLVAIEQRRHGIEKENVW